MELLIIQVILEMNSYLLGELRCVELELLNSGPVSLANLHLVSTSPGMLSLGKARSSSPVFEFPLLTRNEAPLKKVLENGSISQVRTAHRIDNDF